MAVGDELDGEAVLEGPEEIEIERDGKGFTRITQRDKGSVEMGEGFPVGSVVQLVGTAAYVGS